MRPVRALAALALLAACTPAREYCEQVAGRDLADYDALIARTEAELARGYREFEEVTPIVYDTPCPNTPEGVSGLSARCKATDYRYRTRQVGIDPAEWQARIDLLRAKRPQVVAATETALGNCAVEWPD